MLVSGHNSVEAGTRSGSGYVGERRSRYFEEWGRVGSFYNTQVWEGLGMREWVVLVRPLSDLGPTFPQAYSME